MVSREIKHTNLNALITILEKTNSKDVLNKIANNFHVNYQVSEFYDVWGMVNFLCKKT